MISKKNKLRITKEFEVWKRKYPEKSIPKGLTEKKKRAWLDAVYFAQDGKKLWVSGGGRVFLWLLATTANKSMKTHIFNIEKRGFENQYLDVLKVQERINLLKINIKKLTQKKCISILIEDEL